MTLDQLTALLIAIVVIVFLFVLVRKIFRGPASAYFLRQWLVSRGECVFYQALRQAVPKNVIICLKVRMSDLVNCSGQAWKAGYGAKITQKHIDFVLADAETTAIVLAIELDDKSHRRSDRQERDVFVDHVFEAADIPLLRVPCAASYDVRALCAQIAGMLKDAKPIGAPV